MNIPVRAHCTRRRRLINPRGRSGCGFRIARLREGVSPPAATTIVMNTVATLSPPDRAHRPTRSETICPSARARARRAASGARCPPVGARKRPDEPGRLRLARVAGHRSGARRDGRSRGRHAASHRRRAGGRAGADRVGARRSENVYRGGAHNGCGAAPGSRQRTRERLNAAAGSRRVA